MECPICLEIIEKNPYFTPCVHSFHNECIIEWLKLHDSCPLCRSEFNTKCTSKKLSHCNPISLSWIRRLGEQEAKPMDLSWVRRLGEETISSIEI
jgi:Zinc finger, C3HC4 type (RING finger)